MSNFPKNTVWFHGSSEEFQDELRPLYLTRSKAVASMHGNINKFTISPEAKWLDLDTYESFAPHIDSFGYSPDAIKKFQGKGYDIAWDSSDYKKGHDQIFVLDPSVLRKVDHAIKEEISPTEQEKIANLGPHDILTVYHGTALFRLPLMINGFDATQDHRRDYRTGSHPGLFITSDFELAKRFGGGAVLELKVPAKLIHGTDYSGKIGREQERERGKDYFDWIKEKFPNSFRPYLTYTMLQTGEPQGLLRGVVKPEQISRIWIRNLETKQWDEISRKDFLEKQEVYNVEYGTEKRFQDANIDLGNPKMQLDDFVRAYAVAHGLEGNEEMILKGILRWGQRDPNELKDRLRGMDIGGSSLGSLAANSLYKQAMSQLEQKNESSFSDAPNLKTLLESLF